MHGLFKPLESIARSRTWADLIDRTTTAFQTLMRASAEREQIITALVELRRLDTLKPGPNPGLLTRLVEETLETESSERAQGETDGTTLSPLMQARGVPFRAVIVPGLIERSFPQSPSIDPILLDHERQKLNEVFGAIVAPVPSPDAPGSKVHRDVASLAIHAVGQADVLEASDAISTALPPLLPLKVAQISEERLLFRLAVGAARERLVLTFSRIEAESGRERVPSYFLLRTIDALAETQAPPVNGAAVQREPRNEQPWSRPVQSLTPSRRRGKAASRGQLVLPFVMTDSLAAPGVKQLENSTLQLLDPGIESNPVGRIVPATVAMLVRWPGFRHVSLSELAPSPARAVSLAEHDLGAALAESRASHGQSVVLGACASISPHFARAVVAERLRWEQRSFTRYDGLIQDAELLALLRRNSPLLSPISPSRIEDYARCPFHFYMHNLLGLEELEEPELLARSDPAAKGKLVHAILADFLQKMKKRGRLPLTANHTKYLLAIARKYLREFEESGMAGPGLTWQVEREQLLKFFHQFMEREIEWQHEQGYRPDQFELPFGRHDAPEGLSNESAKFDLGNGQVLQFRGIIDRVDISKDGKQLYVIDYKGRQLPNPGKEGFGLGTVVQLPIYLLGAQTALLPKGRFGAAGGAYISYQPEVDPVLINTLDEKSQERLRNILRTIAAGIHNGLFMQYTGQQACRYCPYDRVCMGTQDSVSDLKKGDPAAADYLEMKGGFKLSGNATQ
jgi:RecB family exonuclease